MAKFRREFLFQIWAEGWAATGGHAKAQLMGESQAPTFEEACEKLLGGDTSFNAKLLTHWGCRLFPSEAEARLSFG